jgi:uncharacterized protein (DUF1697 family)
MFKEIKYLALLRGINVGGNNIIKMTELKRCFESMGFSEVMTYIQSGNVVFKSDIIDMAELTHKVEKELSDKFSYTSRVVVISHDQLKKVVTGAPEGYGLASEKYRYDVIFLKDGIAPAEIIQQIPKREGVDETYAGDEVLYFCRLISRASQSRLSRVMSLPVYQYMTIRNWNTTTALLELMEKQV